MDRTNPSASLNQSTTGGVRPPGGLLYDPISDTRKIAMIMKRPLLTICASALLLTGCVALQQDVITLERRLETVEYRNQELQKQNDSLSKQLNNDLRTLGASRDSTEKNLRGQYAGINADMEAMRQDLRQLTGRVEELEYVIKRKVSDYESGGQKRGERLDELNLSVAKMDQRLAQMEQYLNLESKASRPETNPKTPGAAVQNASSESDQQLYDQARRAYDNGEFDKARQLFQKLIKDYPKSSIVDNAQFWIGESYYQEKWYERAILEYQTVIEKYPKGNKVPSAMLKQGLALQQIGEKSSARLIFEELVKKYPKSSEAAIASRKLKEF